MNITDPEVEKYFYGLLPKRDAVVQEMEEQASKRSIPIVGPAVASVLLTKPSSKISPTFVRRFRACSLIAFPGKTAASTSAGRVEMSARWPGPSLRDTSAR